MSFTEISTLIVWSYFLIKYFPAMLAWFKKRPDVNRLKSLLNMTIGTNFQCRKMAEELGTLAIFQKAIVINSNNVIKKCLELSNENKKVVDSNGKLIEQLNELLKKGALSDGEIGLEMIKPILNNIISSSKQIEINSDILNKAIMDINEDSDKVEIFCDRIRSFSEELCSNLDENLNSCVKISSKK